MKTLLAIIATESDRALVERHWHSYEVLGYDIMGFGTVGAGCVWPEGIKARFDTGVMGKRMAPCGSVIFDLVRQELEIINVFLNRKEYDVLMICEPDNVFVRQPPEHPCNGMYLAPILPNYAAPGIFKTSVYFSTPRVMDRKCAERFFPVAMEMFRNNNVEHHVSDRFPALVCHTAQIPWMNYPAWSPLPFIWDTADWKEAWKRDAVTAIRLGACCLHSVKEQWQTELVQEEIQKCQ